MLYRFKLSQNTTEATENIYCAKYEVAVDQSTVTKWLRNFTQVARTLTIRQDLVVLKLWILRPCCEPQRQIWQIVLGECQVRLASHSLVWFVTFMTLAKASQTDKLCLTLLKYCKNFYLLEENISTAIFFLGVRSLP